MRAHALRRLQRTQFRCMGHVESSGERCRTMSAAYRTVVTYARSMWHVAELRQAERLDPFKAAFDEHLELRRKPGRIVEAPDLHEHQAGKALHRTRSDRCISSPQN